jgi:hypothetical protein
MRKIPVPPAPLTVARTHLGKCVIASAPIFAGTTMLEFAGARIHKDALHVIINPEDDRFLQISPGYYLGPSGGIDDLVNHSCSPNGGIRISPQGISLIAIRSIHPGHEISFDYSTTMYDDDWQMVCQCQAPNCRGVIREFKTLDRKTQQYYINKNIVPSYIVEALSAT